MSDKNYWTREIYSAQLESDEEAVFNLTGLCDVLLGSNEYNGKARNKLKEVPAKLITNIDNDEIRIVTKNGFEFILNTIHSPNSIIVNIFGEGEESPSGIMKEDKGDNMDKSLSVPIAIPDKTSEAKNK